MSLSNKSLEHRDFAILYTDSWSQLPYAKRKELDVLGVGAYDKGQLSVWQRARADCDSMWQIGIDVLPQYRRQGIASALTSTLAMEIIKKR